MLRDDRYEVVDEVVDEVVALSGTSGGAVQRMTARGEQSEEANPT